ncbi:putative reverse transcriptase zinc-binding domain-containing protein [Helianthus annuus]|nr:putative reverse transcriptase zinc-binding domain-containing protein [Helianthus annuus]KAJ0897053.1 putative reverse transcriptase zinc-binding domain-containing protein [Helianthus annuus]
MKGLVGNGKEIRFWLDWWIGNGPLKDGFQDLFALERNKKASIEEMIERWEWRQTLVTEELRNQLQELETLTQAISLSSGKDSWEWILAKDGIFSVASTRLELCKFAVPYRPFDWIKWVPKKENVFGWRGVQDRLATMVGLKRRGLIQGSTVCKLCGDKKEYADHLFTGCYIASVLLHKVSVWYKVQQIFAFTMKDLLDYHKQVTIEEMKKKFIQVMVIAAC